MATTVPTYAPYPPTRTPTAQLVSDPDNPGQMKSSPITSGTITNVHCDGAIDASIYDASGNILATLQWSPPGVQIATELTQVKSIDLPVNLPFSGGAAYVVQKSPSSITLTID